MAKSFHEIFSEIEDANPTIDAEDNVVEASNVTVSTPDKEGELYDESVRHGKPIGELRVGAEIRRLRMNRDRNLESVRSDSKMAKWLGNDMNKALVSYDDYDKLRKLNVSAERLSQFSATPIGWGETIKNNVMAPTWGALHGIGNLYGTMYGLIQEGADLYGFDTLSDFAAGQAFLGRELVPTIWANYADDLSPEAFDRQNQEYQRYKSTVLGKDLGIPFTDIAFRVDVDDVFSGAVSLVPTVVAAGLSGGLSVAAQLSVMAGVAGLQSYGSTYAEKRWEHESKAAATGYSAMAFGITALLTRIMPGGTEKGLLNLTAMMRGSANPQQVLRQHLVKAVGKDIVSEFFEEGLDEFVNALLVDHASFPEAVERGLKGGTIGGILGGSLGLSSQLTNMRMAKYSRAAEFRVENEEVASRMDETDTVKRSQELAGRFMQESGGVRSEIFMDAADVSQMIDEIPEAAAQLSKMGITPAIIKQATENGTPIVMNLARMHANTDGLTRDYIFDNARETIASPSDKEAGDIDAAQIARQAKGEEIEHRKMRKEFQDESERLIKALMQAKHVTRDIARDALAPLIGEAVAMWQRHGDAFAESPAAALRRTVIRAMKRAQAGEPQVDVSRGTLQQSPAIGSPEFDTWFSESKIVDDAGDPLILYHGTPTPGFSVFNISTEGVIAGAGIYLGDERSGNIYKFPGGESMPLYVKMERPLEIYEENINAPFEVVVADNPEIFGDTDPYSLNPEQQTEAVRAAGYDGIIHYEGLKGDPDTVVYEYVVFDPDQVKSVENVGAFDPATADIYQQDAVQLLGEEQLGNTFESRQEYYQSEDRPRDITQTEEFRKWSGGAEVIDSDEVNNYDFPGEGPWVLRVYHGTTHDFTEFDATRANLEGQFGRVNYFTSSEYDAEVNYAGEGPDLTNRIQQRAEQLEANEDMDEDAARAQAESELRGGSEQVVEVFVKVSNPFIVGKGSPFVELVDTEGNYDNAVDEVASNNDITSDEVREREDEFDEEIHDALYDIESESPNKLIEAIQTVAARYDIDVREVFDSIYELAEGATQQEIEKFMRESEQLQYAEDPETGELIQSQIIGEIIQEMGYDAIILKDANDRFENMDMPEPTAHVHVFDEGKTNIKSVENRGAFDITTPNIYMQTSDDAGPRGSLEITQEGYIINLFEGADLSTLLHETGHIFLEDILNILGTGNASTELATDWQSIAKWQVENKGEHITYIKRQLSSTTISDQRRTQLEGALSFFETSEEGELLDAAGQFGHNLDETTAAGVAESFHEMWARGFEQYLREGVSPSLEMESAFGRFRRWLAKVYKSALDLNVNMTEEMRGVFNRVLATESEIQNMTAMNDLTSRTAEELEKIPGVGPERRGKLNKKIESMRRKAGDKIYAERTRQADKMRKTLRKPVTDAVMARRVYKAWLLISKGGGMSSGRIAADFGREVLDELRRKGLIAKLAPTPEQDEAALSPDAFDFDPDVLDSLADADETYVDPGVFAPSRQASVSGIPLAPGDSTTIMNAIDDMGGITRAARDSSAEYNDMPELRGIYGRILKSEDADGNVRGLKPDLIAQQLEMQGVGDGTVNTMWAMVTADLDRRVQNKKDFKQAKVDLRAQLAEHGMLPDEVAQRSGYANVDEMIMDLRDARNPKREVTFSLEVAVADSELEMTYMGAVIASAQFAEITDTIGRYLSAAFKGGQSLIKRTLIRRKAKTAMADMEMRDAVRVDRFEQAVQKAFSDERQAQAKDDYAKAMADNEQVRLMTEMVKEAKKSKAMRDKLVLFARKVPTIDKSKIEYGYWYQAYKLAARFGLVPDNPTLPIPGNTEHLSLSSLMVSTTIDDEMNVSENFESWLLAGNDSTRLAEVQQQAMMEQANSGRVPKNYQMLKVYEFEELSRLMSFLIKRGRMLKDAKFMGVKENVEEAVDQSIEFSATVKDKQKVDALGRPVRHENAFIFKAAKFIARWFTAPLSMIGPMMRTMDGYNGPRFKDWDPRRPMARLIEIPSAQADQNRAERYKEMNEMLEPHLKVIQAAMQRMGTGWNNGGPVTDLPTTPAMHKAHKRYWDAKMVLAVALNMGNEYNATAMARGIGWMKEKEDGSGELEPDIQPAYELMKLFTAEELEAIQGVWDAINTLWADSRKVHEDLYGFPPGKVEADAITVTTADGSEIELKGGYWPLRFETEGSGTALIHAKHEEEANLKAMFGASFVAPSAKRNHLMARTNSGGALPLLNASKILNEHLAGTITLITHGRFVRDARRLFQNPRWADVYIQKMGEESYRQLNGWLKGILGSEVEKLNIFDASFNVLKGQMAVFVLAFKAKGILSTLDAVPTLMAAIGPANYLKGAKMIADDKDGVFKMKMMLEYSAFMRERLKGSYDREARELTSDTIDFQAFSQFAKTKKTITKWALATYSYPALMYEWPAWVWAYDHFLELTGDHDTAVTSADLLIRDSQPSSSKRDQSEIFRSRKGLQVMGTMFKSWAAPRTQGNIFMAKALRDDEIDAVEYGVWFLFTNIISPTLFAVGSAAGLTTLGFGADDDDREEAAGNFLFEVAKGVATDPLQGIPFAGDIGGALFEGAFDPEKTFKQTGMRALGRPTDPIKTPFRLSYQALDGLVNVLGSDDPKEVERGYWDMAHLASYASGIPASKLAAEFKKGLDAMSDEE